ncbi:mechanosensitive ion channel family protein [Maribius pontilimi]|uniref:Mechanosensitive ion channel family protein n=1 Tax=Palleronia pontilimi TaxID=1964209 RepID=A0A934IJD9_9RHOB|nr:DUF3772 domain-containing protein [Palleronia pontilimi]MBJ3764008.1 mechanosensitive ion channel family protein [Palleronia pontilimi]
MTRLINVLAAVLLLLSVTALPIAAQDVAAPDYDAWTELTTEVEDAIDAESSADRLEDLRAEVAARRETFLAAQDINANRIATVESQLEALGPEPAEGEAPEAADVAERREQLNSELSDLRAPVMAAEEAFTLANGLITQIDRTIRERYAQQLLAREPSPVNPIYWLGAVDFLVEAWDEISQPVVASWQDDDLRARAIDRLAAVVPLSIISLLLIFRSRWWIRLFAGWVVSQSKRGRGVLFFMLSLGQILFPTLGVFLMARAAQLTGLFEGAAMDVLIAAPFVAMPIFIVKWLSNVLFGIEETAHPFWRGDDVPLKPLRRVTVAIGYIVAALFAIELLSEITDRTDVPVDVVRFLPRLLLGYLLVRLGRILMRMGTPSGEGDTRKVGSAMLRLLGRLSVVAGCLGVVLAAIGYSNATQAVLIPAAMTLGVTAVLGLLQKLVSDLYALVTGTPEGETEALAPLLIGFMLALGALPVYALIWGARVADLTEVWSRFRAGFAIGDTRISPTDFLSFLLIFALGYGLTRFLQGALRNTVLPKTKLDVGGRNAVVSGVGYVGIFLAALIAITGVGIDLTSLAVVAGALSVGIGFGLQNVVSNFVSGIILLIERPISEGDMIQVGDQLGYVRDISVRSTRIETFDRTDVIVPNADLVSNSVVNWTRGNSVGRVIVPVGVAYGTDTEWVSTILREIAEEHPMVVLSPPPAILFRAFGASSLDFEIRAIIRDVNFVVHVQSELLHAIDKRFKAEGIEIPFPQQDLWLRNPETLPGAPKPGAIPDAPKEAS